LATGEWGVACENYTSLVFPNVWGTERG
jgi:hypothetical protein